jgi:hypothetical protein
MNWFGGYNRVGPESLGEGRLNNQGAQPLLTDLEQAMLWQALSAPPPEADCGMVVTLLMDEQVTRPTVSPQRAGISAADAVSFALTSSASRKADPVEQEAWKKKLTQEAVKVQAAHPDADVEVWCEDEHRLGLKPIMRRSGYLKEKSPQLQLTGVLSGYGWLDSSIPHPDKPIGGFYPRSILHIHRVLADFARHVGAGKDKRILLALDQAGCTSVKS